MAVTKYPAALYGATLTSGASSNTKGAWVELVASTPSAAIGLYVSLTVASQARGWLVDIGIGAAASETAVIANLIGPTGFVANNNQPGVYIPCAIAAGTRISARCQNTGNQQTLTVSIYVVDGSGAAVPTTYGADTATSLPTAIDAGATPDTKGAYAQIVAATAADLDYLILLFSTRNNQGMVAGTFSVDLATGAAASEVVLIPDMTLQTTAEETLQPLVWAFPVIVAAGTRLAARCASTITDATDRVIGIEVIGVTDSGFNGGVTPGGGGGAGTVAGATIVGARGLAQF